MYNNKIPVVYILANKKYGVLYTGVTSDFPKRKWQHNQKTPKSFSGRYNCSMLVYYEVHESMESAILREKQIKAGSRKQKLFLIDNFNPEWKDLSDEVM